MEKGFKYYGIAEENTTIIRIQNLSGEMVWLFGNLFNNHMI